MPDKKYYLIASDGTEFGNRKDVTLEITVDSEGIVRSIVETTKCLHDFVQWGPDQNYQRLCMKCGKIEYGQSLSVNSTEGAV